MKPRTALALTFVMCFVLWVGLGRCKAGPNAGGVILLHCNEAIEFSSSSFNYCGLSGLSSCEVVDMTVDRTTPAVFFALAAFPESSSPRLVGVTFGIDYDSALLTLVGHWSCGDAEATNQNWPAPMTGTTVFWNTPQMTGLTEFYWFAAYDYSASQTAFRLTPNPINGGLFGSDEIGSGDTDPITDYGSLGFFAAGYNPCAGTSNVPIGTAPEGLVLSLAQQPWIGGRASDVLLSAPESGACQVNLYDVSGRLVAEIFRGVTPEGRLRLTWDGREANGHVARSGVYFVIARMNGIQRSLKAIVVE